ncbi:hypothetical protein NUSPORA_01784 [Nucleospora cyclopteri]
MFKANYFYSMKNHEIKHNYSSSKNNEYNLLNSKILELNQQQQSIFNNSNVDRYKVIDNNLNEADHDYFAHKSPSEVLNEDYYNFRESQVQNIPMKLSQEHNNMDVNGVKNNKIKINCTDYGKNQHVKLEILQEYWKKELFKANKEPIRIKSARLPLARIKRLMKVEEDVKVVAQEVPVLFSLAAEKFIEDFTLRAWLFTIESKRKILQVTDVQKAARTTLMYDFLVQIIPDVNNRDVLRKRKHK